MKGTPVKKTVLAVVLAATAVLSTGCGVEAVAGAVAEQTTQGSSGQQAGTVDAMTKTKERIEAKAYASPVVAEHESMMAGQEWTVTGGSWKPGAAVTVTLKSQEGAVVGASVNAVAGPDGNFDAVITIPEGTVTGTYSLEAADSTGKHATPVNVFSS